MQPELIPEWEPDVKKHIPDEATLDARIASYARLADPPPKLRSKVLAREQGVPVALQQEPSSTGTQPPPPRRGTLNAPERERLGQLRKSAVNGLIRIEKGSAASTKGKGKMRESAVHLMTDLSGIAGEWTLDPALPRLGSAAASQSRPSLGGHSTRSMLSATGSRNSLSTSDQGHSVRTDSSVDLAGETSSSIWKKRKRIAETTADGQRRQLPTAVFETDKGNIDIRLAIVDEGSFPVQGIKTGDTVTEQYMTQGTKERKGLLNARVESDASGMSSGLGVPGEDTCARVEVLTRKGNVRVEVVCRGSENNVQQLT